MKNIFLLFTVLFTINFCSTKSDPSNQNSSNPDLSNPDLSKYFDGKYNVETSDGSSYELEIKDGQLFFGRYTAVCYIKSLKTNVAIFKMTDSVPIPPNLETMFGQFKLENNILYISELLYNTEQQATIAIPTFEILATKIQ